MDVYHFMWHSGGALHPTYLLIASDDWQQVKDRARELRFVLHNGDRTRALVDAEEEDRAFALRHPGEMFTSNCVGPQGEAEWVPATREARWKRERTSTLSWDRPPRAADPGDHGIDGASSAAYPRRSAPSSSVVGSPSGRRGDQST